MIEITAENLKHFAPNIKAEDAENIARYFMQYAPQYGVDTPVRIHYWFANSAQETAGLTKFEENLNYSANRLLEVFPNYFSPASAQVYANTPIRIANRVYGNRYGNGDEESGDGWKYRGRGLFQTTFKDNYRALSQHLYGDGSLLNHPDDVATPALAVRAALYYWQSRGLSALADAKKFKEVVKGINGGTHGLGDRSEWLLKAQQTLV